MDDHPVLVTGAAGFIGSHLVKRLVSEGRRVVALVKENTDVSRLEDVRDAVVFVHVDIADAAAVKELLYTTHPVGVFHLAASNIASGITASDKEVVRVNLLGTKNLMDGIIGLPCRFFVNTGSFMEYGPKDHPVLEDDTCAPTELYSITKLGATLYGQSMARQHALPAVTIRLFTPYGPHIQPGRLAYEVVRRALCGEDIMVGDPSITRDFVYADDVVDCYLRIADRAEEHRGEIFNCGGGQRRGLSDFVHLVLRLTKSSSVVHWNSRPALAYDAVLWQANISKAREKLGWEPRISFEEGIERLIQWMKIKI